MRDRRSKQESRTRSGSPADRVRRGRLAEDLAARRLEAHGWRVLARNVRRARGEIDIVALDGDTVVFVEVRSRKRGGLYTAEASVGRDKRRRLLSAAAAWLAESGLGARICRFDVIVVEWDRAASSVRHVRGAFLDEAAGFHGREAEAADWRDAD